MNIFYENSNQLENFENSDLNQTFADGIASNSTDSYAASIDFYGLSWIFLKFILFLLGKYTRSHLTFGINMKEKNLEKITRRRNIQ
jgi:hypothetical protein